MNNRIAGIILLGIGLAVLFFPNINMPGKTPVPEEFKPLLNQVKASMSGDNAHNDAQLLSGCLRAAANQFTLDVTRPKPYYADNESLKWAIRTVGDLSYPIGWKMQERYPALPKILGDWLTAKLGDNFSRQDLVNQLRGLSIVLEQV